MALEHPADGDGDRAVFLRDDHDDRVGNLARANACAVARTEVARQVRIVAQRHDAARRSHTAAADNDRAVVQGRVFKEEIAQQLLGQLCVDDGAGLEILVERRFALENQQDADTLTRHDLAGLHRGGDGALLGGRARFGREQMEMQLRADTLKRAAKLRLEHDDERDCADLKDLVEQPV